MPRPVSEFQRYPLHLYHAGLPARVCLTPEEEAKARAEGYSETYQHQAYPKWVGTEVADSPEHEQAILAKKGK